VAFGPDRLSRYMLLIIPSSLSSHVVKSDWSHSSRTQIDGVQVSSVFSLFGV